MLLCLPTTDDRGLAARLSPHFGSAPCFTLVDTASGTVDVVVNDHAAHEHGRCDPMKDLQGRSLDAVVCRGLGQRALMRLQGSGIAVLVTEAFTVAEALTAFQAGTLRPMGEDEACDGRHGHGHHHDHASGPEGA
jgi:predicted Fe-Mo cluster-binding NifX family protein